VQAGIKSGWAGPICPAQAGRPPPGWAGALSSGWAEPAEPGWALAAPRPGTAPRLGLPAGSPHVPRRPCAPFASRLGRQAGYPGWAARPAAPAGLPAAPAMLPPAGRHLPLRPGWAGSGGSGLAGNPLQAATLLPRLGRIKYPGWVAFYSLFRLGQAGIPWPRPDYYPLRPKFISSGILPRPASPPAHRASPGMPPGSDWHIFHRHMLVLGRPLSQTSISILS
jgi:hypothetical protein